MAEKKKKGFFAEFREFLSRGNVLDMAIGVVMGAAFKTIIDALVNGILMPVIGLIFNTESLADYAIQIGDATIAYGTLIDSVIDFVLIGLFIFIIVKVMNTYHEKMEKLRKAKQKEEEEEEAAKEPEPSKEELLLTEIRDLLKKQAEK